MSAPSIKRDDIKQAWEKDTEFPLVCETCLGDNPYVRMTKEPHGKKCQVCETPFTVFAWQAGTKGRLKRVEICRQCAQAKNVCQVCIYDLQYGLPVKVRDKVLREAGGGSGSGSTSLAVPQSTANRAWFSAQQERALAQGQQLVDNTNEIAHAKLAEMAQMEPRYERNLPKLCTFYARGECDRGANCPFRHEMPRDRNEGFAASNTKDRFYGTNDAVAKKILGRRQRFEEKQTEKEQADDYDKARATLYLRVPDGSPELNELDIRDAFYAFGEIVSVRVQPEKAQAFVEYTQPEAAELAIASMNRQPWAPAHGTTQTLYVAWARAPKRGDADAGVSKRRRGEEDDETGAAAAIRPLAPPGDGKKRALPTLAGFKVKPPPEVAALAAARKQQSAVQGALVSSVSRSAANVPRPAGGGGPTRRAGGKAGNASGSAHPYYPSADPSRLGTKS